MRAGSAWRSSGSDIMGNKGEIARAVKLTANLSESCDLINKDNTTAE